MCDARNKTTSALVRISDENLHSRSFNLISPELSYNLSHMLKWYHSGHNNHLPLQEFDSDTKYSIQHTKSAQILIVKINLIAEKMG